MSKPIIAVTNEVAWALGQLNSLYGMGCMKGFTAQVLLNDGSFATLSCGDISHIEKLGLIEVAKDDAFIMTMED